MALDVPHIASSAYATTAYTPVGVGLVADSTTIACPAGQWFDAPRSADLVLGRYVNNQHTQHIKPVVADMPEKNISRFVRVIIVDPNENLSLEDRLVYKGEEKFTDLNDQELFFELEIKALLASHNERRVKTVDKTVKERTEYLEAVKIRDLKMVVVNIATF